jgi:hypothetical protein
MDKAESSGWTPVNEPEQTQDQQEPRSPEEIRKDIEQTREELGDTAEALAAKADVKGQAKAKVDDAKQAASDKTQEFTSRVKEAAPDSAGEGANQVAAVAKENPVPVAVGAAVLFALLIWILRR